MKRALLALAACGSDPAPRTSPLWSDGTNLRDEQGRVAVLRGVNARVAGVFDVALDGGRTAVEPIPELTDADCQRMHALGLDFLRLPINWSGVEPTKGAYADAYLDAVDAAVQCAARANVLVMIDLHQDAYSKEIGEDGAPLWAIQPPPTELLQGPLTDLGARRSSAQVTAAFATFFDRSDPAGLQAAFFAMLERVAARWADDPAVIGFEVLNEPTVGDPDVQAFDVAAAAHVRAAAPTKLVMFEPSATRNLFDYAPKPAAPFAVIDAVYAPHVYTYVFDATDTRLEMISASDLEASVSAARDEATAWGTPLLIGEFGIGPTQINADLWMGISAQMHDKYLASDAFWVWREISQGGWGLYDVDATERPQVLSWLSRPHAARIAGDKIVNTYDPATRSLHLEANGTSQIYVPDGYTVTCNGTAVSGTGWLEVACDGAIEATE